MSDTTEKGKGVYPRRMQRTGKVLRVDLSAGESRSEDLAEDTLKKMNSSVQVVRYSGHGQRHADPVGGMVGAGFRSNSAYEIANI